MMDWRRAHRTTLAVLLALQALVILVDGARRPLGGDEFSYVQKARALVSTGSLPRAGSDELTILERRIRGNSDYRPVGYPIFLAVLSGGHVELPALRYVAAAAQFGCMAAALFCLQSLVLGATRLLVTRWATTIVLGIQPWTFEYAMSLLPDSLNASITTFGSVALVSYVRRRSVSSLVPATILLGATLFLRAEMILAAPVMVGSTVFLSLRSRRKFLAHAAISAAIFVTLAGVQVGYRHWFIGRWQLYGPLLGTDWGAYQWIYTWPNTEKMLFFVWSLKEGRAAFEDLPPRAFDDDFERKRIQEACNTARVEGLTPRVDDIFATVASRRIAAHPVRNGVIPRVLRMAHLWFNLETNAQLLSLAARVPAVLRRAVLGLLLALKVSVILLGLFAVASRTGRLELSSTGLYVFASWVVFRTLFIGVMHGSMEHRYVLVAWPAMMVCAAMGLDLALSYAGRRRKLGGWSPLRE